MEFLLLLPLLLVGGLVVGGSGGGDDGPAAEPEPSDEAGEVEAGTTAPDEMAGTVLNDILLGGLGRDTIEGLQGNDVIAGERGNDDLTGDEGNDVVLGGAGNDRVDGATGNDLLVGGAGNDTVTGGAGNDLLIGSSGSDTMQGGEGDDTLVGVEFDRYADEMARSAADLRGVLSRNFADTVSAQQLNRVSASVTSGDVAERGPDQLEGGDGNDLLLGDDGDFLSGGLGADEFAIAYRPDDAMSIITDFDHQTESLTLILDNPDTAQIVIRPFGPLTTLIEVDGQPVVRLSNQDAEQLLATRDNWLTVEPA
ncbi:calcium-binding protein [Pseudotabrizicola algicola]|uniref:Calcium-binding protein n=1 Tax=Pseudotabrizicola algicola TaxID=2709381 RepID=A0A6B3RJJ8_9RHOB|nr:calcium-binding protein [Pseudotabrizicola algicola]NEX46217.1 calcium-binding protein [Pseudotabrizicola algicola]